MRALGDMSQGRIPTRDDWGDLRIDHEVAFAFGLFGGSTCEEAKPLFVENPIERAAELRCAPAAVFNYYVFCFVHFLQSPEARGAADAASCFLELVRDRTRSDPTGIAEIYPKLEPALDWVATRQTFFDADVDIYGSFLELHQEIDQAWAARLNRA